MPGLPGKEVLTITHMNALELAAERQRLIDELLEGESPQDAFERVAILEMCKADPGNLEAAKLVHVEEALQRLSTHDSNSSKHQEEAEPQRGSSKPALALVSYIRGILRLGIESKEHE